MKFLCSAFLSLILQNSYAQFGPEESKFHELPVVKIQAEYNSYLKNPTLENANKIKAQFDLLEETQKSSFADHKNFIDFEEALTRYESSIKNFEELKEEDLKNLNESFQLVEKKLVDAGNDEKLQYVRGLSSIGESYVQLEQKCKAQGATHKTLGECDEGNIKELRSLLENHVTTNGQSTKDLIKNIIPVVKSPEEVVLQSEEDSQCSETLQDLIKAIKGNEALVAKMFNVASVKMALAIAKSGPTKSTLEEELKEHLTTKTSQEKELSENVKKLYEKYGKEENVKKLSYYKRDTRLTNENSSAMIELYLKKPEERTGADLTEADAAVVWAMENLRVAKEQADPNYKIGMPKGNMMNFSSRVYAHLTDFGRNTKREEVAKVEEKLHKESEALSKLLQPVVEGLTEDVKRCLALESAFCDIPGQDKSFLEMISAIAGITKEMKKEENEEKVEKETKCEDSESYQVAMANYAITLQGGSLELCKGNTECKTKALEALDAALKTCPDSSAKSFKEIIIQE